MAKKKKRPPLKKRVLKSPVMQAWLPFFASLLLRFLYLTARAEHHWPKATEPYADGEKPAIFCFWHGRLAMHAFIKPPRRRMLVLISRHNDGALITGTMRWLGVGAVRGSKKSGAAEAVREMLDIAKRGDNIAITPDGPRGPFQVAAPGATFVAMKTGYPLIPVAFSAARHWRFLKSWDRFMLPKPFTKIVFVAGKPIHVAEGDDQQAVTAALNAALNTLTGEADRRCGVAA